MMQVRKAKDRGCEDKGWLKTCHTFSFDTYYDPDFLGYRALRVINEDIIQGGKGFGAHPHKDMEIVTYVLEGILEHKDSMGNTGVIRPGEVQRMTAGTGVVHSEQNLSHETPVHLLQIWIYPEKNGLPPEYTQRIFPSAAKWGQWCLMVSRNGRNGSIRIHQDVDLYSTLLDQNEELIFDALFDRYYWIQIVSGSFQVQGKTLEQGDAAAINDESTVSVKALQSGELLLFDLA